MLLHINAYLIDIYIIKYGDSVNNTVEKTLQRLLPFLNVLVAISKGMQTVKLCTNKILQFLTGCAG